MTMIDTNIGALIAALLTIGAMALIAAYFLPEEW